MEQGWVSIEVGEVVSGDRGQLSCDAEHRQLCACDSGCCQDSQRSYATRLRGLRANKLRASELSDGTGPPD
jgi:hypothetical protein